MYLLACALGAAVSTALVVLLCWLGNLLFGAFGYGAIASYWVIATVYNLVSTARR